MDLNLVYHHVYRIMLNTLINKRYFIKEKISRGGFCDIYKASDIYEEYFQTKREVVLKIPNDK
ncbi:hypothetical protein CRV05_13665, partial [Halarcobacter bivalviorum]